MAKILIIEDELNLREEIIDWLNFEGYEVIGAENGLVGVDQARKYLPDIILCDVMMPVLDGNGVLLELRSNPSTLNIPFIFLTAKAAREDVRKGMGQGADDYIAKPFERLELLESIQMRLDKRRLQAQEYQQQLESLYQALDAENERRYVETRLASEFSHDVRNFLAMIMSANGLVRNYADRMPPERRDNHLGQIEASSQQVLQMVDDLYTTVQLENGLYNLNPESLDLATLIEKLTQQYRLHSGRMHRLTFHNELTYSNNITLDARLVRLILGHLLANAVKFSPQNSEVIVTCTRGGEWITLTVSDNGIGIPSEDIPRIFRAFQRGSNVEQAKGAGLGLLVVHQAIELHGGYIDVKSEVGVGTTVTVTLPSRKKEESA